MLGELFWVLAGGAMLGKAAIAGSIKRAERADSREKIQQVTDKVLEQKLWQDIHNPLKYNEIWERIEGYKAKGGYYAGRYKDGWKSIGETRLEFFNKRGQPVNAYQGNREFAHRRLMETYEKLPIAIAIREYDSL